MPYNPSIHHRHSLRLKNYDYSQAGAYFITLVTYARSNILGEIVAGDMVLSTAGELACQGLLALPEHYPAVEVDDFVLMPNHLHAILVIQSGPSLHSLSEIVRGFKTFSARKINLLLHTPGSQVWQQRFYDHIFRDEEDLRRVRAYIRDNPRKWFEDEEYRG